MSNALEYLHDLHCSTMTILKELQTGVQKFDSAEQKQIKVLKHLCRAGLIQELEIDECVWYWITERGSNFLAWVIKRENLKNQKQDNPA
jgi:hypothetical protein